jgi:carboxyl-terminal processing protease
MLVCLACYLQARRLRWVGDIALAMDLIESVYVEPTDPKKLYRAAMHGIADALDPYSEFIEAEDYTQFQRVLQQEFGGLGIRIHGPPDIEHLTIVYPIFGTPAFRAGLEAGDIIVAVEGKSTKGLRVDQASKLLQGQEGTSVHLTIQRKGIDEPLEFDIVRAAIELESVVGDRRNTQHRWEYFLESDPEIAYLRVTSFGEKTVEEMKKALAQIRSAKGLILDLRDNPGGLLPAASDLCDMFLEGGPIVSTKIRGGVVASELQATPGSEIPESVNLVVLVNGQSASASEIVAACLQDRGRAAVAGDRSFGKGSVQNIVELDGGKSAFKLTVARYYPPSGRNIHRNEDDPEDATWGIMPDEGLKVVLSEQEQKDVYARWRVLGREELNPSNDPTPSDLQMDKAVEYLRSKISASP